MIYFASWVGIAGLIKNIENVDEEFFASFFMLKQRVWERGGIRNYVKNHEVLPGGEALRCAPRRQAFLVERALEDCRFTGNLTALEAMLC